jgi:hypothetical protein
MSAVIDPGKRYPCKEGTVPALVHLKPCTTWPLVVGTKVSYRRHEDGAQAPWQTGIVTRTNADGYFFLDRH